MTLVLDVGSYTCRAGFAGEDNPRFTFPTIVGRPRQGKVNDYGEKIKGDDLRVGNDALSMRSLLTIKYPVEYGIVTNWDDYERILYHTFYNELRVSTQDYPVLLSEHAMNPKANREKTTQLMFETFDTPAMYLAKQPVLSLYSSGRLTGLVVESGSGMSHAVPVYEGHVMPHTVFKHEIAGSDVTWELVKLLDNAKKYTMSNYNSDRETVRDMKEKIGYVALDFDEELEKARTTRLTDKQFELPDGLVITVGEERFRCTEILFQPSLHGFECWGIHEAAYYSVQRCDVDLRAEMFDNIVLDGGNMLFPGIEDRFKKEIEGLDKTIHVNVEKVKAGVCSVWKGGSMLASLPAFKQMTISRSEYEEFGPALVHQKCF